ncbi:MAG: hypothetical protein ACK47F_09145, partial [Flavobacteriales bacterium]
MKRIVILCLLFVAGNKMLLAGSWFNGNDDNSRLSSRGQSFMQNSSMGFEQNIGQVSGDHASEVKYFSQIGDLSIFLLG